MKVIQTKFDGNKGPLIIIEVKAYTERYLFPS